MHSLLFKSSERQVGFLPLKQWGIGQTSAIRVESIASRTRWQELEAWLLKADVFYADTKQPHVHITQLRDCKYTDRWQFSCGKRLHGCFGWACLSQDECWLTNGNRLAGDPWLRWTYICSPLTNSSTEPLAKQEYIRMSSSCSGNSRSSLTSSHTALNIFAKLLIIFYGIHWNKKQNLKQKFVYQLCMLQFSIFNQAESWEKLNFPVDFQNISSAWGALLKKEKDFQRLFPFSVSMPCFYKFDFLKLRQRSW